MTTYNVALKEGVDYDAFWTEIETNGVGSAYVPSRGVDIVNARPASLRQCWYDLTDSEADKLRNDPRVYCVGIPPEFRTDIEMVLSSSQTGTYSKIAGTPNSNWINWGLFRTNSSADNTSSTSGTQTYNYPLDGSGVDFVIQDSGCQIDHPEFTDANGVTRVQQINWYTASGVPGTMPAFNLFYNDTNGHGTHCAGIAAGKTYGRAKNSKIYVMTVSGLNGAGTQGLPVTDVFDCIKGWHNNKSVDPALGYKRPTVVNMSWTYRTFFTNINGGVYRGTPWTGTTKQSAFGMIGSFDGFGRRVDEVDVDVAELLAAGVVLVGSAGNWKQTLDNPGGLDYDNYFNQTGVGPRYYMRGGSPPCSDGVICVGSVGTTYLSGLEVKSDFSDSGPRVDIYAPGSSIVSAISTTYAPEFATFPYGVNTYPGNPSYRIANVDGTSMAAPNVAGIAAQLLQLYPTATPAQIRQKIIDLSTPNMLYTTGLSTDYSDSASLHGGPNRYAYQPYNSATNVTINLAGGAATNISLVNR
jgi:subtilisin family serine protease